MNEERDFVVFTDDDGNDFELDVIDYFDYNDKEYAVLVDTNDEWLRRRRVRLRNQRLHHAGCCE